MDVWAVVTVGFAGLFYIPAVFFISCVIFLAAAGKTLGIRELYVKFLLLVFEVRL